MTRRDSSGSHSIITQTTYGYDAQRRHNSSTDARNGKTSYTFNDADQVATVTTPNPGDEPQVTTTFYNNMGRVTGVLHPDNATSTNTYFTNGLLKKISGSRTYPVEYSYDSQGRLRTNKTWQSFSTDAGTAITRWNYDSYRGWLTSKDYPDGTTGVPQTTEVLLVLRMNIPARDGSASAPGSDLEAMASAFTQVMFTDLGPMGLAIISMGTWWKPGTAATTQSELQILLTLYDRLGRRSQVVRNGTTTTITYDDANLMSTESYSGGTLAGLSVNNVYDNNLRRTTLEIKNAGTVLQGATYAFDNSGRLQTVTDGSYTVDYGYEANSSLVSTLTSKQSGSARLTSTTKKYDKLNRLTSIVGCCRRKCSDVAD